MKDAAAIGIIGSADGPTSIFIARALTPYATAGIVAAVVIVGGLIGLWCWKHRG